MTPDTLIDNYFKTKSEVHALFGYEPNWVEIPLDDQRDQYWMLVGGDEGTVVHSPLPFTPASIEAGKVIYSAEIYTQRHLKKWVYRTDTHVLISIDTRTDGNKFLAIFDATKECTDEVMKATWRKFW